MESYQPGQGKSKSRRASELLITLLPPPTPTTVKICHPPKESNQRKEFHYRTVVVWWLRGAPNYLQRSQLLVLFVEYTGLMNLFWKLTAHSIHLFLILETIRHYWQQSGEFTNAQVAKLWWWEPLLDGMLERCFQLSLLLLIWCVRTKRHMQLCLWGIVWYKSSTDRISFLSVHQALHDPRNGINYCTCCKRNVHGNPGMQMTWFDQLRLPFFFDGPKCFYEVQRITDDEIRKLQRLLLLTELYHMNRWLVSVQEDDKPLQCLWIGNAVWVLFLTMSSQRPLQQLQYL